MHGHGLCACAHAQESDTYGISKAALMFGLTKTLAVELAQYKIRVNCLAPGLIQTKFGEVVSC